MDKKRIIIILESSAKIILVQKIAKDFFMKERKQKVNISSISTSGHIKEINHKLSSISNFRSLKITWQYNQSGENFIKKIKAIPKDEDVVFMLALDSDREGEAIAKEVLETICEHYKPNPSIKRVYFKSITKEAIYEGLEKAKDDLDEHLLEAYRSRVELDLKMGFGLSPIAWSMLSKCRSVGRVQTCALTIIYDHEVEVLSFKSKKYFTIKYNDSFGYLYSSKLNDKKIQLDSKEEVGDIIQKIDLKTKKIEIKETVITQEPKPPFDFLSFQSCASKILYMSGDKSSKIAQSLYEKGLITYPRTDSQCPSQQSIEKVKENLMLLGFKFVEKNFKSKKRSINTQEAHEAIMPTFSSQESVENLNSKDRECYEFIKNRALASMMESAKIIKKTIYVSFDLIDSRKLILEFHQFREEKKGFKEMFKYGDIYISLLSKYGFSNQDFDPKNLEVEEKNTKPPSRLNESKVIEKMRKYGIGRPSTVNSIIQGLQKKRYFLVRQKYIFITPAGILLSNFVREYFSKYFSINFTSSMERNLDLISCGKLQREELIKLFFEEIESSILNIQEEGRIKIISNLTDKITNNQPCDKCTEGIFRMRYSSNGPFAFCNAYPECKNIKNLHEFIHQQYSSQKKLKLKTKNIK